MHDKFSNMTNGGVAQFVCFAIQMEEPIVGRMGCSPSFFALYGNGAAVSELKSLLWVSTMLGNGAISMELLRRTCHMERLERISNGYIF